MEAEAEAEVGSGVEAWAGVEVEMEAKTEAVAVAVAVAKGGAAVSGHVDTGCEWAGGWLMENDVEEEPTFYRYRPRPLLESPAGRRQIKGTHGVKRPIGLRDLAVSSRARYDHGQDASPVAAYGADGEVPLASLAVLHKHADAHVGAHTADEAAAVASRKRKRRPGLSVHWARFAGGMASSRVLTAFRRACARILAQLA